MAIEAQRTQVTAAEYEACAADDDVDLAKIADAQKKTFDTSVYYHEKIWGYSFPVDRVSQLTYEIYAAHSFSNGNDFYLVNLEAMTTPKGFFDTYIDTQPNPKDTTINTTPTISAGTRTLWILSTDDVSLSHHAPVNFKGEKTQTNGETWTLEGTLGFSGKSATGQIGYGKSHTNALSWTVSDFEIKDQCETDYSVFTKYKYCVKIINYESI